MIRSGCHPCSHSEIEGRKVCIWLPGKTDLKGWMWNCVLEMPEVRVRRIVMPTTAFGTNVDTPERQSDLLRLKILYEEGGLHTQPKGAVTSRADQFQDICLDTDLVALKSLDEVIHNPTTRATVMAMQRLGEALPNSFIMSKTGSPFLQKWIQRYMDA